MLLKKDIKPIFTWAIKNGDVKIVTRILIKLLPFFIKDGLEITEDIINNSEALEVSENLYDLVKSTTEDLVGISYKEIKNV